jgi:ectoine hydroxylase-related dioxygenase (phytanoyl-CoA dioxygenase family)
VPRPSLEQTLERLRQPDAERVEISGERGDVIFFHHRLVHAAGRNRKTRIRQAMLAEFRCRDWEIAAADSQLDDCWFYWRGLQNLAEVTPSRSPRAS